MGWTAIWPTRIVCASVAVGTCTAAAAQTPAPSETIRYSYDARGRLVQVERAQPTVTVKTKYTFDKADNRTSKEVTTTTP